MLGKVTFSRNALALTKGEIALLGIYPSLANRKQDKILVRLFRGVNERKGHHGRDL